MKLCLKCKKDISNSHPNKKFCESCKKERQKEWYKKHYQKNKDKILTKHKEYNQNNPEKIKELHKNYYLKNKKRILEKNRRHYKENPNYYKNYRLKNKDKIKRENKKWREENQDYLKQKKKQDYNQNKKQILLKAKQYNLENKEKIRLRQKIYREKNKEILNKKNREWIKNNRYSKKYYQKNRDRILARTKQYRKKNPEKFKEYEKRYAPRRKIVDQIKYKKWKKEQNKRRKKLGLPLVGEGYKYEQEMKAILDNIFSNQIHKDNCRYKWLNGMELDRFYPNLKLAFEYNGEGHFQEIPFFRGSLKEFQQRDQLKRELCQKANITLIEMNYFEPLTEQTILKKLYEKNIKQDQKLVSDY